MPAVTYFVAMPFVWSEDGELVPGEAQERMSAGAAGREAARMAATAAGAVAFSRTGDPGTGAFEDAAVFKQFGELERRTQLATLNDPRASVDFAADLVRQRFA